MRLKRYLKRTNAKAIANGPPNYPHGLRVVTRSYALSQLSLLFPSAVELFHNFDFKQLWPVLSGHVDFFRVRVLRNAVQNLVAVLALAFWVDVA